MQAHGGGGGVKLLVCCVFMAGLFGGLQLAGSPKAGRLSQFFLAASAPLLAARATI